MAKRNLLNLILLGALLVVSLGACSMPSDSTGPGASVSTDGPLRMAISPYQDTAFLVNIKSLALEKKYGTNIELLTLPWEDILPAVASAGKTVDVGYASLTMYLTKLGNLNRQGDDPVLFVYPFLVFKGNGFVTFNPSIPELNSQTVNNPELIKKFFSYRIGCPKNSMCQMLLFMLAQKAGIKFSDLSFTDTTVNDGLLAAENGSLDMAGAGVTQRTEAIKRHGRVVLDADAFGIGDIVGLVCKESTYKKRKKDIESLIKMQFDCEKYVLSDLDHHSAASLAYLRNNASTKYTLSEYKHALTYQDFPLTVTEAEKEMISNTGRYSIQKQTAMVNQYLMHIGIVKTPLRAPAITSLANYE